MFFLMSSDNSSLPEFAFDDGDVPGQCAQDTERTKILQQAIGAAIKDHPNCVVLDCGTGAGLLALFAVRAGASHVVAVEGNKYLANWAKINAERNGYGDKVTVIYGDAGLFEWPQGIGLPDIIMGELLTTWCVSEHQVQVMNNLHARGIAKEDTLFLPCAQEGYLSLTYTDYTVEGIELLMPQHNWNWYPESCPLEVVELTDRVLVNSIQFDVLNKEEFSQEIKVTAHKDGVVNSVYLTSRTLLYQNITVGDTMALNAPIAFPLEEKFMVKAGDSLMVTVQYIFGAGYGNFKIKISRI